MPWVDMLPMTFTCPVKYAVCETARVPTFAESPVRLPITSMCPVLGSVAWSKPDSCEPLPMKYVASKLEDRFTAPLTMTFPINSLVNRVVLRNVGGSDMVGFCAILYG